MAVSFAEPSRAASPRLVAEQLRRFLHSAEGPPNSQGANLSDAGFVLLTIKDQLLANDSRATYFLQEFVARPINGVDLLLKVVVVLQGIVNSSAREQPSKLSTLLTRNNTNNTNRKRKAAVAEADCIECIKILLEKNPSGWRTLLEQPSGLEVILYSVNSPQLDSKCYALEIVLLLLDQPQGFIVLFRALSVISARTRDYLRLQLFVSQLKHGLHTQKLHIQILVSRLFNKLLSRAPTPNHRMMAQIEATLSQFSAEYIEKLVLDVSSPLGGMDTLMEELAHWRSQQFPISLTPTRFGPQDTLNSNASTNIYGYNYSETESDTSRSDRGRLRSAFPSKFPSQAAVAKNVERARMKRQGPGSGGRASGVNEDHQRFYPNRSALTLNHRDWDRNDEDYDGFHTTTRVERVASPPWRPEGGMRRAKSESAMLVETELAENNNTLRGLKRSDPIASEYHPIEVVKPLSRSTHDLSRIARDERIHEIQRPGSAAAHTRSLQRPFSPQRARFADPPTIDTTHETTQPHAGFSYLFPSQPVVSQVPKRNATPEPYSTQMSPMNGTLRPPSSTYEGTLSPRPVNDSPRYTSEMRDGQVVYIPITMESDRRPLSRFGREPDYDSRSTSRSKMRSPSVAGDDVRDALSQFDYLNDYDASSLRGKATATYHL
ncbi:unnamed protein product, partial [Mesorhabditis belari]|uniref:Uncharacterized protein n=1 Tax=Mesorhabditis belari TaxID=2138241 RepID=A0AAF3EX29_9BILA